MHILNGNLELLVPLPQPLTPMLVAGVPPSWTSAELLEEMILIYFDRRIEIFGTGFVDYAPRAYVWRVHLPVNTAPNHWIARRRAPDGSLVRLTLMPLPPRPQRPAHV